MPVETKTVTAVPTTTCVPAGGSVRVTWPNGTVDDDSLTWLPTFSPSWPRVCPAALGVWPIRDGICTCCLPEETTSCTADPLARCVPAGGLVLITTPAGTVLE